ncbi:MAG: hypothetical protein K2J89_04480 [Clostridia bacterium]|nr:hypothetical protein [Clostridia bacterium]
MKKFMAFVYLIPVIFIIGLILIFVGSSNEGSQLAFVGTLILTVIMPIFMVILVGVGLASIITGKAKIENGKLVDNKEDVNDKNNDEDENTQKREEEYSNIKDINSSYGYENREREARYISQHSANIYKNSTLKEKVFGWLFLGFLLGSVILAFIFAFLNMVVGMIVCFALFGGTILITLIVKTIAEKVSMSSKIYTRSKTREIINGEVKNCFLSSTRAVGFGGGRDSRHSTTSRITKVVYRVTITANGSDYNAYSETFYEKGDSVVIAVIGKRQAKIVSEAELKEQESLLR